MNEILSSWEEIATYLGKGVRTVQRWERELELPIHRPGARQQRIVMAFEEDLSRWVEKQNGLKGNAVPRHRGKPADAVQRAAQLAERMQRLTAITGRLQQQVITSLERIQRIRKMTSGRKSA